MKYIALIILLLNFECLLAVTNANHTQQNIVEISVLYDEWHKQWGNYEWSDNALSNKAYAFETSYAIVNMINKNDIVGIKHIFESLKKDSKHDMIFFNGIIGEPTFEKAVIDKANFEILEFLLNNNIVKINAIITDDALCEYTLLAYANKKLQTAKFQQNFKAVVEYKHILNILLKYEVK